MFRRALYILIPVVLISCNSQEVKEEIVPVNEVKLIEIKDELIAGLEQAKEEEIFNEYLSVVSSVYEQNSYAPFWLDEKLQLNEEGNKLAEILFNSMSYGLDTNRYSTVLVREKIKTLGVENREASANGDVLLTNLYFKFAKDINLGIVDTSQYQSKFGRKVFNVDLQAYFVENKNNLTEALLALQPQIGEYQRLQQGLERFLAERTLKDTSLKVKKHTKKSSEKDSIKIYAKAKEVLVLHDYLDSLNVTDTLFIDALKEFQINHGLQPDAKIGKNTARALSGNPMDFYRRAAVSLEKWRWVEPDSLEDEYLFANIATYKLKFYKEEEMKQEHKVVVGTIANKTPELDSEIEYMVAYPFWTVPYSIKTKELVPKSKKDSTYLSRNNYQLLKGGKVVPMSSVNWSNLSSSNFNYTVRQKGGRSNALGLIKFIFPNKYAVYFHDTPSKHKFLNDIRTYSHGCVRVEEPMKLAEYLLARESESFHIDSVKATIDRRERKTITLKKGMPVHIRYFTAEGDADGNVLFYPDVYGREKELEEIMFN